jgi:hypothetical protein
MARFGAAVCWPGTCRQGVDAPAAIHEELSDDHDYASAASRALRCLRRLPGRRSTASYLLPITLPQVLQMMQGAQQGMPSPQSATAPQVQFHGMSFSGKAGRRVFFLQGRKLTANSA